MMSGLGLIFLLIAGVWSPSSAGEQASPGDHSCELPAAAPGERIVLVGSGANALATVTVAGQDEVTQTARVVVESGAEPLYVVLSAYRATIWRFEGQVERVARLVVVGMLPQGTTGIARERVFDRSRYVQDRRDATCFPAFSETRSVDGVRARGIVERALGRAPDVFAVTSSGVGTLRIPSVKSEVAQSEVEARMPRGFDPSMYLEFTRYYPGGLVWVDAAAVSSNSKVEPYEVLPGRAGLAQLVASGALERLQDHDQYFVAKPIARFPAGLHGAERASFVLGKGIPLPAGDPGHSCVVSEETGLPVSGVCPGFPASPRPGVVR